VALQKLINALESGGDVGKLADNFLQFCFGLVRDRPGFKTYPVSKKLRNDPRNKELFEIADRTNMVISNIKNNPTGAAVHFNVQTAAIYARIMVLCAQVQLTSSSEDSSCES
jgi:hypothetical protein